MACGCPVAVSRVASLPEVCGDAAVYFDPTSVEDIARGILDVLDRPAAGGPEQRRHGSPGRSSRTATTPCTVSCAGRRRPRMTMRFLFTTLQTYESEFYGRVGEELRAHGHDVCARDRLAGVGTGAPARAGIDARCLPDVAVGARRARLARRRGPADRGDLRHAAHPRRLPGRLGLRRPIRRRGASTAPSALSARSSASSTTSRPTCVVPEVGNETIRVAAHLIGLRRGIPVLFLLYTIFPNPLRLYVDTLHAPIVAPGRGARADAPRSAEEVEAFRTLVHRARRSRSASTGASRSSYAGAGFSPATSAGKRREDRDNDYLRPWRLLHTNASEWVRARAARPFYDELEPGTAVRLLPAARHRRLQDHADHPALRRPGVARRAGRGRTAASATTSC